MDFGDFFFSGNLVSSCGRWYTVLQKYCMMRIVTEMGRMAGEAAWGQVKCCGGRDCSIPGGACAGAGGAPTEQGRAAAWQRAAARSTDSPRLQNLLVGGKYTAQW